MNVVWAATAWESRRFDAVERESHPADLEDRFDALRSRGEGYLEVRRPGSGYPLLALGFRGGDAVVHLFRGAEETFLLTGDGTVGADTVVEVPVMDDLAAFGGAFVLAVDRAWAVVRDFVRTGATGDPGEWREL
ncbi:hypothetical protein ABZ883_01340 [Streptomyces sp. NPDC046977]|uniref:hypothetical protein n=1 Tax=Streptomyces sp. NPDC046977 TaxID=3154703 RepID=UPI0033CB55F5